MGLGPLHSKETYMNSLRHMLLGWIILLASAAPAVALVDADVQTLTAAYTSEPEYAALADAAHSALDHGVPPDLLEEVTRRASETSLPAEDLLAVYRHAERVAATRLPVAPVLDRYLKGLSRGVPFARIQQAAQDLEQRLVEASRRLDSRFRDPAGDVEAAARLDAIDEGAFALSQGVAPEHLDRSVSLAEGEESPYEAVRHPLFALGVLAASGVQSDRCLEVVSVAWDHGYRGNDLERLGRDLGSLVAAGEDVIDGVLEQIQENSSKDRVLDGLDELSGRSRETHHPPGVTPGEDPTHGRGAAGRDKPTRDTPTSGNKDFQDPD
jgi:hypothetical protein